MSDVPISGAEVIEARSINIFQCLWSEDERTWDVYAPGAWTAMQAAFRGERAPLQITSCPQGQPLRSGQVTIRSGSARVQFTECWENPWEIELTGEESDVCQARCSIREFCAGFYPDTDGEVAARTEALITTDNFAGLMHAIDAFEYQLIQDARERGYALAELLGDLIDALEPAVAA